MKQNLEKLMLYPLKKAGGIMSAFAVIWSSPLEVDEDKAFKKVSLFNSTLKRGMANSF